MKNHRDIRHLVQHYLNALHVYCFLMRVGLRKKYALSFAKSWERVMHWFIY